jgi:hypothetical protein
MLTVEVRDDRRGLRRGAQVGHTSPVSRIGCAPSGSAEPGEPAVGANYDPGRDPAAGGFCSLPEPAGQVPLCRSTAGRAARAPPWRRPPPARRRRGMRWSRPRLRRDARWVGGLPAICLADSG